VTLKTPTVNPSAPGILWRARKYQRKLESALAFATRIDARGDARLAALYASARVEGVDTKLRMRKATVSFVAPPFKGGYHLIFDWSAVDESTARELAMDISWSLRHSLRERTR
jgi:hypothetical protein